jgi:hypothetical protein
VERREDRGVGGPLRRGQVPVAEGAAEGLEQPEGVPGLAAREVGLGKIEAHQGELLGEAGLVEVVPDGGEGALGGGQLAEAAADPRLKPGEHELGLGLLALAVEGPHALEAIERLGGHAAVVEEPDEDVPDGELEERLPPRLDEGERPVGEDDPLGGVLVADGAGEPLQRAALQVAVAVAAIVGGGGLQQGDGPGTVAAGELEGGLDPQQRGALEEIAGAGSERLVGLADGGAGGVELVIEAQGVGEAGQGAGAQVAVEAGRVGRGRQPLGDREGEAAGLETAWGVLPVEFGGGVG